MVSLLLGGKRPVGVLCFEPAVYGEDSIWLWLLSPTSVHDGTLYAFTCDLCAVSGSIDTDGPIVAQTAIFFRYLPFAAAGLAFTNASSNAWKFSLS